MKDQSLKIGERGLEGIALGPTGDSLLVVKEENNEVLMISLASEEMTSRHVLSDMTRFGELEQHFSGGRANVERGEQGGRAVALVIVGHGRGAALLQRQAGLGAIERLDLGLLIDREHQRVLGRVDVEPDHVPEVLDKTGVKTKLLLVSTR